MDPEAPDSQVTRGRELLVAGRFEEAAAVFGRVRGRVPDHPGALFGLGLALQRLGRWEAAEEAYARAGAVSPGHADAHNNRGTALEALGRPQEAEGAYRQAVAARPGHAEAWCNLANGLKRAHRFEESIAAFRRAIEARPDFAEAWSNLGGALKAVRQFDEAHGAYRRALQLKPGLDEARFNEALLDLLQGDYAAGWAGHEFRWSTLQKGAKRDFPQPVWRGEEALAGQTILLHAEQGLGDTIQFVRYAPLVAARGARVILEVQKPLVGLLTGCPGVGAVVARGDPLPAFDCHCPLLSLPLAFGTEVASIPAPAASVQAPAASVEKWRWVRGEAGGGAGPSPERGPAGQPRRIGVVWAGNPRHANDRNRSLPAEVAARLFAIPGVAWFSLQLGRGSATPGAAQGGGPAGRGPGAGSATVLPANVVDLAPGIVDFSDTAGILANLDGVVAVDTAVAHLAGALGVPTWLLLPFDPDWRWLLDRSDSPWYPSLRLQRQPAPGDWASVVEAVGADLRCG